MYSAVEKGLNKVSKKERKHAEIDLMKKKSICWKHYKEKENADID